MESELFSQDLTINTKDLPVSIIEAANEIKSFIQLSKITILEYDEETIAIPVKLKIDLPSKGTYNNLDIRSLEPVLICIKITEYPTSAPSIRSDRKDFPSSFIPHLYAVKKNTPPALCLVRGELNEWYANRRISDLIITARQWFSKAASGLLSTDADEFEPVRLEGYSGYSIYIYSDIVHIVESDRRHSEEYPFRYLLFITKQSSSLYPTFKHLDEDINIINLTSTLNNLITLNLETLKSNNLKDDSPLALLGLLVWSDKIESNNYYSTFLPRNYRELEDFAATYNIPINKSISQYIASDAYKYNPTPYIPVIIAVKRPRKIVGFASDIEFFNFVIHVNESELVNNTISPEAEVLFQSHREPVNIELAQKLSLSINQDNTIFLGAGALGSKIIFHFARSGNFNLKIIDCDKFSPHNIVRHDLFMESSGENKAKAIFEKIHNFNPKINSTSYETNNIFNQDLTTLNGYNWLIDTTASLNVQNWLVTNKSLNIPNRAKAEIAYKGSLGFLYIEGKKNNPRLDDLVYYVYYLGQEIQVISSWLTEENKKKYGLEYDIVDIGIGCNSPTVIMPNDSMSFHAARFSKVLNSIYDRKDLQNNGLLLITYISDNGFISNSFIYKVPPLEIYSCARGSGWEIRLTTYAMHKIKYEASQHKRKETGGILIGICNYKTKSIHVFDTIIAPPDSKRAKFYFFRGIKNLPDQVKNIKRTTGDMIGYIGEWHTHPNGFNQMSQIDLLAVKELKPLNDLYPIPTLISILSGTNFLPYVF